MATVPLTFQSGTAGERLARVDQWGNLEPLRVAGRSGTATEAANAATLNTQIGKVTLSGVLNAGAGYSFTLTNSFIRADSVILLSVTAVSATADATRDAFTVDLESQTTGACVIHVYNGDAANSSAAPVVNFLVV